MIQDFINDRYGWIVSMIFASHMLIMIRLRNNHKEFKDMRDYILARDKCYQEMMIDYAKKEIELDKKAREY